MIISFIGLSLSIFAQGGAGLVFAIEPPMLVAQASRGPGEAVEAPVGNCAGTLTRRRVVDCVRAASPRLRVSAAQHQAASARAREAAVRLPSNPSLGFSLNHRNNGLGDTTYNLTGRLSQEFELAGQRRRRIDLAQTRVDAALLEGQLSERELLRDALLVYFDLLSLKGEAAVLSRGVEVSERLYALASARDEAGVGSALLRELASARRATLRAEHLRVRGRIAAAATQLVSLMGVAAQVDDLSTSGDLSEARPQILDRQDLLARAHTRSELKLAGAKRREISAQVALQKRERAPSPSLSVFAGTDGFGERVIGGGVTLPIPLPAPLGRTSKAEIEALGSDMLAAEAHSEELERTVLLEVELALHAYLSAEQVVAAYAQSADAQGMLHALSLEIEAGRVDLRDALLAQSTLLELQLESLEAQHELAARGVWLDYLSGAALEGSGDPIDREADERPTTKGEGHE